MKRSDELGGTRDWKRERGLFRFFLYWAPPGKSRVRGILEKKVVKVFSFAGNLYNFGCCVEAPPGLDTAAGFLDYLWGCPWPQKNPRITSGFIEKEMCEFRSPQDLEIQ